MPSLCSRTSRTQTRRHAFRSHRSARPSNGQAGSATSTPVAPIFKRHCDRLNSRRDSQSPQQSPRQPDHITPTTTTMPSLAETTPAHHHSQLASGKKRAVLACHIRNKRLYDAIENGIPLHHHQPRLPTGARPLRRAPPPTLRTLAKSHTSTKATERTSPKHRNAHQNL